MSAVLSAKSIVASLPARDEAAWLSDRRAEAVARLDANGFTKSEKWKGTDLAAFVQEWAPAQASTPDIESFGFETPHLAVLVDGQFSADLSTLGDLPHDFHVESLASAIGRPSPVLSEHLDLTGERDSSNPDSFADWNMAAWTDGLFVTTGCDVALEAPLHILHIRTGGDQTASFPRVLVHVRDRSNLTVIEHFVGASDALGASIAVTELVAHDGATLNYNRIQEERPVALHSHSLFARADRDAQLLATEAAIGAGHGRLTFSGTCAQPGAHIGLHGFFLAGGKRRSDTWTRIDHAVPNTTSNEVIRGVLGDESRGAFTGNVLVRAGAQKTSAHQQNRNLLLSRKAHVDAQPQLEIHADDVQCSHGSTVGQLDEEALFFLRSRGLDEDQARVMLTKAFLAEVVDVMAPLIRDGINRRIEAWFERHPQSVTVTA